MFLTIYTTRTIANLIGFKPMTPVVIIKIGAADGIRIRIICYIHNVGH